MEAVAASALEVELVVDDTGACYHYCPPHPPHHHHHLPRRHSRRHDPHPYPRTRPR